jgi:molybdenum cofactor biosynthesis protein B
MGHCQKSKFISHKVKVITVSDTRDLVTDKSGELIEQELLDAGHLVIERQIVRDEIKAIREAVNEMKADVFIVTGGTGATLRDVTPEALEPLFDKALPGFGELFRHLSFPEIGTATIQSRACAGIVGGRVVFSIPGSTKACKLAMSQIILPQLDSETKPCSLSALILR